MTSKQRLLTALEGKKPDRVPVQIYGTMGYRPEIIDLTPNHKKLAEVAMEKCDLNYAWGPEQDIFYYRFLSSATEVEEESAPEGTGEVVTHRIKTPDGELSQITYRDAENLAHTRFRKTFVQSKDDLDKILSIPYEQLLPEYKSYFEFEKWVGDKGIVINDFPDAMAVLAALFDPEDLSFFCIEHESKVIRFLEVMSERINDYLRFLLEKVVKPVFLFGGPEYAAPPLMGPDHFKKFVYDFDKKMIQLIHDYDGKVILHCHGMVKKVLSFIRDMQPDGIHPIEAPPMGDVTLKEARQILGNDICLIGNIQIGDMYSDSPDEIDEKVRIAIEEGGVEGSFILGLTASLYSNDFSDKVFRNYMAYIEAGLKYGGY